GLEVDDCFVFDGRLHRQVGGLVAAQDAINIASGEPVLVPTIDVVGHQAAGFDHLSLAEDSWQAVLGGKSENQIPVEKHSVVRREKKTAVWLAGKRVDDALDLLSVLDRVGGKVNSERGGRMLGGRKKIIVRTKGVGDHRHALELRRDLFEHAQPFSGDAAFKEQKAGQIAA